MVNHAARTGNHSDISGMTQIPPPEPYQPGYGFLVERDSSEFDRIRASRGALSALIRKKTRTFDVWLQLTAVEAMSARDIRNYGERVKVQVVIGEETNKVKIPEDLTLCQPVSLFPSIYPP
jgi:ribosomal protein L31E